MNPIKQLSREYDYLAPDGSEIRLLAQGNRGGLAHCTLPSGQTSKAQVHKTVDELWYFLTGRGQLWLSNGVQQRVIKAESGLSVLIPVGTKFQFRNTGARPLQMLIATMPPWPGKEEAVEVQGKWKLE
jgi:mannose-6-phosphate isomerase-like protein (cupin superfamily)